MNGFSQSARSIAATWFGNGPWRSKSVLAALAALVAGLALWISDIKNNPTPDETNPASVNPSETTPSDSGTNWNWRKPFPGYVRVSASYVAAYCIGWLFRRVLRLIFVTGALVVALIGFGKFAGWDLTRTQEQITRSGEWARHEATTTKDQLSSLLPSATAAGIGMFLGFRRRNKARISDPAI